MLPGFELIRWFTVIISIFCNLAVAYRPVQFVKHTGENGRADQGFSLTNYYNETTQQSDLYVRMECFRYSSSARGWAALALGGRMTGSLMYIIYGNPTAPGAPLTLTWRTANGHHPPRPVPEMPEYDASTVPEVTIVTSRFEEYTGDFFYQKLNKKPSHLGVAEFIIHGYTSWSGAEVLNATEKQNMIWSSNFKQDFQDDFSFDRGIEMHQFGLGFGFVYVDLLNAAVPTAMFGAIKDLEGHKGVNEIAAPVPPTEEELAIGKAFIESNGESKAVTEPESGSSSEGSAFTDKPVVIPTNPTASESDKSTTDPSNNDQLQEPVRTPRQWNIRSLMWHLHGLLMVTAFMVIYPMGAYLIRSPQPTAFNLHWTIQSLGSVLVTISAIIGYLNSHSISVAHQYLGFLIIFALAAQLLLGWRHHISYLRVRHATWMSQAHMWLGRLVLPTGMFNIILGLMLRQYGWFTIGLTFIVIVIEVIALFFILIRGAKVNTDALPGLSRFSAVTGMKRRPGAANNAAPPTGAEAEEYFQLAEDDEDEFSDDDANNDDVERRATREQEKRERAQKLAKLDKV